MVTLQTDIGQLYYGTDWWRAWTLWTCIYCNTLYIFVSWDVYVWLVWIQQKTCDTPYLLGLYATNKQ